jgi:hypothetical protein
MEDELKFVVHGRKEGDKFVRRNYKFYNEKFRIL